MPFLFLVSLIFAAPVDAEWIKLLHFEKTVTGTYHSRASSNNFFSSLERSPESELVGFLKSYDLLPVDDNHVICKFPLRAKYVVKKGYKKAIINPNCPTLQKFKDTLAPVGVSLIFSSYFLDSPASTFGHTFLRLRRNTPKIASEHQVELLDHGMGYAANATTNNPLLYSVMGFIGGFDGVFSLVPYYYKVREYNDAESRDLWSYDLNMTDKEMEDLVDHLWEVGQATFPYYYLTENCSYYILEILEIVTCRKLLNRIPFWIIPVDTIKATVEEPGFVKDVSYRPSLKSQFEERVKLLTNEEKKQVRSLKFESSWSTLQIDAAIEYLELKYPIEIRTEGSEEFKQRDFFLSERAKRRETSKLEVPTPERPDRIHPSNRAGVHLGYNEFKKGFLGFEQRFAYYDPLDPPNAKPPFSEIIFMDLAAKYFEEDKDFAVEKSDLVRVKIRNPFTLWLSPMSYSITFGGTRDSILCQDCYVFRVHYDFGFSVKLSDHHLLYTGLYNDFRSSAKMDRGFGYYLGPIVEMTNYWLPKLRSQIRGVYLDAADRDVDAFWDLKAEVRWDMVKDKISLSASHSWINETTESRLGLYYYY
jgi:hypothetical protein